MLIIFIRTAIILVLLMIVMRLMGKRQIGEMQPYEFIITLLIAEVACVPMSDVSIPLLYGIASIIAIFILHQILSFLELLGQKWKRIVSGTPSIIIDPNGVNSKELQKNNLDIEDLLESLRTLGYFALEEVKYAILESNGKLSVLQNPETENSGKLPVLIIDRGKFVKENLKKIDLSTHDILSFLKENSVNSEKNIEVMTLDDSGKVYLQEKFKQYRLYKISTCPVKT